MQTRSRACAVAAAALSLSDDTFEMLLMTLAEMALRPNAYNPESSRAWRASARFSGVCTSWKALVSAWRARARSLCFVGRMTDQNLGFVAHACPCLEELDLGFFVSGFTDAGLLAVKMGCPLLRVFSMSDTFVTNKGLAVFLRGTALRELELDWNTAAISPSLDADCIPIVIRCCPLLENFALRSWHVTPFGGLSLAGVHRLKSLSTLCVDGCGLPGRCLQGSLSKCPALKHLVWSGNEADDADVQALVSSLGERLTHLDLSDSTSAYI